MAAQGDAHVVHLQGDGIAPEQAFVQQLDVRALDEAQLQQTAFQLDRILLVMTMGSDLDDHSVIAASGLAQLDGLGQIHARTSGRPLPSDPAFL